MNPLDQVLIQDAFDLEFVQSPEGNDGLRHAAYILRPCGGVRGHGGLDESMGCQPDLTQPAFNGRAQVAFIFCRHGILTDHVPCARSAKDPDLPQLSGDGLKAAAERRILDLSPRAIVSNGARRKVDRHGVARHGESRPPGVRIIGLAEHEIVTPAGKFDRLQIGCAERPGCGI